MFDIKTGLTDKMEKTLAAFKNEVSSKCRVGGAQPSMIASLIVNLYGANQPLSQMASISNEGMSVLVVKPWDKKAVPAIEKAIHSSDLGVSPLTVGDIVRVAFPPLSEERRKEIVKLMKSFAEQSRVAMRNFRRDANTDVKQQEKDGVFSEDASKRLQDKIQESTDKYIKMIDTHIQEKEVEIMKV